MPCLPFHHPAEMRHGHVVSVDFIVMHVLFLVEVEVRDHLVAEEVEVHPFVAAAAFRTAKQLAVELARRGERVDGNGEMKWLRHGSMLSFHGRAHQSSRARTARSGWSEKSPVMPASS